MRAVNGAHLSPVNKQVFQRRCWLQEDAGVGATVQFWHELPHTGAGAGLLAATGVAFCVPFSVTLGAVVLPVALDVLLATTSKCRPPACAAWDDAAVKPCAKTSALGHARLAN